MLDYKNTITNLIGLIIVLATSLNAYFENLQGDINWFNLIIGLVTSLIAYYTGKSKDGSKKSV